MKGNANFKTTDRAIPAVIMWELWKMRNLRRHDKDIT